MNETKNIADQLSDSAGEFLSTVGSYMPKIFGALLLLVLAVIVAKLVQSVIVKGLQLAGVDKLAKNKNVSKGLKSAELNLDFIAITGRIFFWVVIVIFALTIADVLGLTAMSEVISGLLGYLPSVLAAAIVLTVAVAGARLIRDVITASLKRMRVDYGHVIGNLTFYIILVFGTIMAIDQLGFDTTILTANITLIVGGFVLAFALAFGLGGRDLAGRLLDDAYDNIKKAKHKK